MKQIVVIFAVLLIFAALFVSVPQTHAALDATCSADPSLVHQYDVVTISCSGFDPNTHVWVYEVEPDGAATAYCLAEFGVILGRGGQPSGLTPENCASFKTDEHGDVSFTFTNGFAPFFTRELGTWKIVVEELGPGGTKVHQGVAELQVSGAGETVSGATLAADPAVLDRTQGFETISGTGFAPNEIVSLWIQFPSNCSSFSLPIIISANGRNELNYPLPFFEGGGTLHTFTLGGIKADSSGSFELELEFTSFLCSGDYRFVARALGSGLGGFADFIVTGGNVDVNATLVASKSSVNSMNDSVSFSASGFAPNESLACWLTSPEGQAIPMLAESNSVKVDGTGAGVVWLYTGALRIVAPDFGVNFIIPVQSQGALGEWAMSCRGNASGKVGVANFLMVGGSLDP